jgi:hypothetical protein
MASRRRKTIFWAGIFVVVNVLFLLWFLSVPAPIDCDGLVGLPVDNCQISQSGRGLTIGMIVFACLFVNGGLALICYTARTGVQIGSEEFRRYGGFWGYLGPVGWLWWSRTRRWRRE